MDIERLQTELVPVFSKYDEDIIAAYLFGSVAQGAVTPSSDIDIALLLRSMDKEKGIALKFYIYADLCRQLKRNDIDLVLLDMSGNLILNDQIIRHGKILYSIDDDARDIFELRVLHACTDFKFQRRYAMGV